MDPLVTQAGTALVAAIATDGWQKARDGAVALWRRVHPERVPAIEGELEEIHQEVVEARRVGDQETEDHLIREWRRRLARLMATDPTIKAELQQVFDHIWQPLLHEPVPTHNISMIATAIDHSQVNQAGRDQTIPETKP